MKILLILLVILFCSSCSSKFYQNHESRKIRIDSVYRTMSPEEQRQFRVERVTRDVLIGVGIIVIGANTIPLIEYEKKP